MVAEAVCQFCVVSSVRGVDEDKDKSTCRLVLKGNAVRCLQEWPSYFSLRSEGVPL